MQLRCKALGFELSCNFFCYLQDDIAYYISTEFLANSYLHQNASCDRCSFNVEQLILFAFSFS